MKRLLIVLAGVLVALAMAGVAESQGAVCDGQTCQWRASTPQTQPAARGFPLGGRLVPVKPFIRPVQPQQPTTINVPAPQVIMQPDPSGARAADALDRIAANTEPPPLPDKAKESGTNPLVVVLCAVGAAVVGFILYYVVGKG